MSVEKARCERCNRADCDDAAVTADNVVSGDEMEREKVRALYRIECALHTIAQAIDRLPVNG